MSRLARPFRVPNHKCLVLLTYLLTNIDYNSLSVFLICYIIILYYRRKTESLKPSISVKKGARPVFVFCPGARSIQVIRHCISTNHHARNIKCDSVPRHSFALAQSALCTSAHAQIYIYSLKQRRFEHCC